MTKVTFDGPEDFRVLAAADLAKAGVEGFKKTSFSKGQLTEIDDAAAAALMADPDMFGRFSVPAPVDPAPALISTEEVNTETPSKKSVRTN